MANTNHINQNLPEKIQCEHGADEGPQTLPKQSLSSLRIEIIDAIRKRLGGNLLVDSEIFNNGKSSIWAAFINGQRIVIKTLVTDDSFYSNTFKKELEVYKYFRLEPPGLGVPSVLLASDEPLCLVLEYIDGQQLSKDRYPGALDLNVDKADMLLGVLERLRSYQSYPCGTSQDALQRYMERWNKYIGRGIYSEDDKEILIELSKADNWTPELNHGDPIPSNVIFLDSIPNLIDWEFAGSYVPFYDVAVLWAAAAKILSIQEHIESRFLSLERTEKLCFAANLLNVASREVWIHYDLPDEHELKALRLPIVEPLLTRARIMVNQALTT